MIPLLRFWARLLDTRFAVPGTRIRFGLDPILSLIPGLGELVTPMFTVALLVEAVRLGVPRVVLVRMALHALIDAAIGAVPIAGNVADVFWRANVRNLALLERHAVPGRRPTRGDYVFVWGVAGALGLLVAIPAIAGAWLTLALWR